jgi:hypothetical protein
MFSAKTMPLWLFSNNSPEAKRGVLDIAPPHIPMTCDTSVLVVLTMVAEPSVWGGRSALFSDAWLDPPDELPDPADEPPDPPDELPDPPDELPDPPDELPDPPDELPDPADELPDPADEPPDPPDESATEIAMTAARIVARPPVSQ